MVTKARKKGMVHLRFDDGQFFVTPEDYNNFLIAARPAIEALEDACQAERWVEQFFSDYVPILHPWCRARTDSVNACYVALTHGPSLKVFIVGTGDYDSDLGKEISQLELDLEDKGWPSDIIQLPTGEEEELQAFFDPDKAIQVYGQTHAASGQS